LFPTSDSIFTPIYQPILNIYNLRTVSGNSSTVKVNLSSCSPFKTINLPEVKTQVINGTGPTNIAVNNTFEGNFELEMTFASSTPWCQMYIILKY
jgi:hypothetical protein